MWPFKKKQITTRPANPHLGRTPHMGWERSFYSGEVDRLLGGWVSQSNSIDYYLCTDLKSLRARSRELVRVNPYGKRFITAIKSNVVGPEGVSIQSQVVRSSGQLDSPANDAIELAFKEWAEDCDYLGKLNWCDFQCLAISCAAQDGEYLFEVFEGREFGKYGFKLKSIDPELLDTEKNQPAGTGRISLGVEYDKNERIVRYHFRERDEYGNYGAGRTYDIAASRIIHGFLTEWPDQSRGIPWMHASLQRSKQLDKFDEAAMVAARSGANNTQYLRSEAGEDYEGDESGAGAYDGATLENQEPGTIKNIGAHEIVSFDPTYPHQMYDDFVKTTLRGISAGIGVSYHSISNDLEGVNYSSIRAGVLEDREIFKGLQNWLIRSLIKPVYERWLRNAVVNNAITISGQSLVRSVQDYYPAHYQARRWAWVDPQKDGAANELAINHRLKSRSQIMREQGDDPESVWREIEREEMFLKEKGIMPVQVAPKAPDEVIQSE